MPSGKKSSTPRARRPQGDDLYNIRRRYKRAAERYERDAAKVEGQERQNLLAAAAKMRSEAEKYYASNITSAARGSSDYAKSLKKAVKAGEEPSKRTLAGRKKTTEEKRLEQARAILSGNNGHIFYASLKDVWKKASKEDRDKAIVDFFKKRYASAERPINDLLDVIEAMEELQGYPYTEVDETVEGLSDSEEGEDKYRLYSRRGMVEIQRLKRGGR